MDVTDLTDEQQETLADFHASVSDILRPSDGSSFLLRWLKARRFNRRKAETMLRNNLQWRKQFAVDTLLTDYKPPQVMVSYHPGGIVGFDKEGCPVWIFPMGHMDFKGMLHSVSTTDFIKYAIYLLETAEQSIQNQTEKLGKIIQGYSVIFDMDGFTLDQILWKPAMNVTCQILTVFEKNYPERLKKAFVINAPAVFSMAYSMVKPFICADTATKIQIFWRDNWKTAVLQEIDPSVLPAHWGGTRTDADGDPLCRSLVCLGGLVPQSFYASSCKGLDPEKETKTVRVEKKSYHTIEVFVGEVGSIIQWEFKTEKSDISMGLFFKTKESDKQSESRLTEIIPLQRFNCHLVPEKGMTVCEKPGTYVLQFDNTFSWLTDKKVTYYVTIIPPECPKKT